MTYRSTELYIQPRTKRRLRWIVRAIGTPEMTADALGDKLLNEAMEAKWPQIKQIEAEFEAAETRLKEALQRDVPEQI